MRSATDTKIFVVGVILEVKGRLLGGELPKEDYGRTWGLADLGHLLT